MQISLPHSALAGVRAFVPTPVATTLQYVGGAAAILGLVAMASDVEGLYAAVKALVCVVKSNPLASKEMERIRGYQVRSVLCSRQALCGSQVQLE